MQATMLIWTKRRKVLELLGRKFAQLPRRLMRSVKKMKLRSGPQPRNNNVKNKNRPKKSAKRLKELKKKPKGKKPRRRSKRR